MARLCVFALGFLALADRAAAQLEQNTLLLEATRNWLPAGHVLTGDTFRLNRGLESLLLTPTVTWYRNDQPIATTAAVEFVVPNATAADSGNYSYRFVVGGREGRSNTVVVSVVAHTEPPSPVDTSFAAQLDPSGAILRPAGVDGFGRVLLQDANGATTPLRLLANGQLDPAWVVVGNPGPVLAVASDGSFVTGLPPYRFDATGTPQPLSLPAEFDPTKSLSAAAIYADGRVLVAQAFYHQATVDDPVASGWYNRQVRLSASGAVDPTWNWNQARPFRILRIVLPVDGTVLVGTSEETNATDQTCIRIKGDGSLDSSFQPFTAIEWSLRSDGRFNVLRKNGETIWALQATGWGSIAGSPSIATTGQKYFASLPNGRVLSSATTGAPLSRWRWEEPTQRDPSFYGGSPNGQSSVSGLLVIDDTSVLVWGNFTSWSGHPSPHLVRLRVDATVTPLFSVSTAATNPVVGLPTTLEATVVGPGPYTYDWVALDGQPLPADHASPTLNLAPLGEAKLGRYQVRVTNPQGTAYGPILELERSRKLRLLGISGRAEIGSGEDVLIAGVGIDGYTTSFSGSLVRGAGPALVSYGVQHPIDDPALQMFYSGGFLVAANDDWVDDASARAATAKMGLAAFPTGSRDAALVLQVYGASSYTCHLQNRGGAAGVGLLELYDLGTTGYAEGTNLNSIRGLSLRGRVGAGEKVLIGGFVVRDPHDFADQVATMRILVRATGPSLAQYGITNPLNDPRLTLYDAQNRLIASNEDWETDANAAAIAAAARTLGLAPLAAGAREPAVLIDLPTGPYTAQVSSADGTAGIALLEIYRVR